ncbi:hypothetical protein ABPG72_007133 [Tetrahymena utriculariae]
MAQHAPVYAICLLKNETNNISAVVRLVEKFENNKFVTHLKATFKGLPAGLHGFHVHQYGDLSNGCTTAGPHFNPFNKQHGGPNDENRHVGDLGNVTAVDGQDTNFEFQSDLIRLSGETSIVGRSFVIHADEDDLGKGNFEDSKTTGHAGARLACGIIALAAPFENF